MRRLAVFCLALLALLGFALLTIHEFAEEGLTAGGIVALLVLAFLAVTLIGALLGAPRD